MRPICYKRHRFPPPIIGHAIWLYHRFTLSLRDIEDLLAERGIQVSYETIRRWVDKFGPANARGLRQLRPKPHPQWHLDEMFVSIGGRRMYLWRAVDQYGDVLEILVQRSRDKRAAMKLMRKLLKRFALAPRTLVTDKWRAYSAAAGKLALTAFHHQGKWKNNRIENAHQPVRRGEWKRFKSAASAQRFLSNDATVYNHFNTRRHLVSAVEHRKAYRAALSTWHAVTHTTV
jgi:transposase-like protein